jgi:hypothetical protein
MHHYNNDPTSAPSNQQPNFFVTLNNAQPPNDVYNTQPATPDPTTLHHDNERELHETCTTAHQTLLTTLSRRLAGHEIGNNTYVEQLADLFTNTYDHNSYDPDQYLSLYMQMISWNDKLADDEIQCPLRVHPAATDAQDDNST